MIYNLASAYQKNLENMQDFVIPDRNLSLKLFKNTLHGHEMRFILFVYRVFNTLGKVLFVEVIVVHL